jgi:uncharacterized protein YdaU (DUF1376 family)
MHFYSFHIGDYAAHTGHLDPMEDIAYRRLLDAYYLAEGPLPADVERCARLARMRDHVDIVRAVLAEFFLLTDDGWRHARCDLEIERKQEKADKARESAGKRWHAGKATDVIPSVSNGNANAMRTHSEGNAPISQEPIANSQEEEQKKEGAQKRTPISRGCRIPDGFPAEPEFAWCRGSRPELDPPRVGQVFRDFHLARGSTMKDWSAAWRTWVGKERATTQPRASPWQSAADARDAEMGRFLGNLTGGLAGTKPNRTTFDADEFDSPAVRRIA